MPSKIGTALRAARKAKNISLRDLEKLTGMGSGQISQIESGARANPAFDTVLTIARAIGVSLDSLVEFAYSGSAIVPQGSQVIAELERLQTEFVRTSRRLSKLLTTLRAGGDEVKIEDAGEESP